MSSNETLPSFACDCRLRFAGKKEVEEVVTADFARTLGRALNSARAEREQLLQEAQIHAQEARTHKATVAEIYQFITGKTGEPGNWNGAQPVIEHIESLRSRIGELERDAARYLWLRECRGDGNFRVSYCGIKHHTQGLDSAIDAAIAREEKP